MKDRKEIYGGKLTLWPSNVTFSNYIDTFRHSDFPQFFWNSLVVTMLSSLFVLIISVMGGYSLARFKFKGKAVALMAFLVTQMVPTMVMLIPLFIVFGKFGLINHLVSLIVLYSVINIPFCLITLSGFFQRIPISLEEAALIDGCSRLSAVVRVVIPIMLPGIVATFVFAFTGAWNELFFGIMFINGGSQATIPVGLNSFVQKFDIDWGQMSAGGILSLVPVTVLFMFVQKYIVAGLTQGAVKGE
ncbi:carbohydrate ABC transporter permease [Cohnella kolymensis]|uniref:carbohydrate ABC transporter permease n=1 Tax=Cohnella kolymensis TaxID=1590652 RepID=UPI001F475794|nr:carbohydrate ABC transporter permease [Cohnella kolymensis]